MPTDDVIDLAELRQELIRPGGLWQKVDLVPETGSTNADLAARAREGEVPGTVLITDYQSAGRGRQGRTWTAPPGSGIAMSILVRPNGIDPSRWTWLSLLAGIAVGRRCSSGGQPASGAQVAKRRPGERPQILRHSLRARRHLRWPGVRGGYWDQCRPRGGAAAGAERHLTCNCGARARIPCNHRAPR